MFCIVTEKKEQVFFQRSGHTHAGKSRGIIGGALDKVATVTKQQKQETSDATIDATASCSLILVRHHRPRDGCDITLPITTYTTTNEKQTSERACDRLHNIRQKTLGYNINYHKETTNTKK